MQADILTITLNPALDMATFADRVEAGPKLRCDTPRRDPGGGGINVARVVSRLGGAVRPLVALGGATGAELAALMAREGLDALPVAAPGDTRISMAVTDRSNGGQYRFVLPGPAWRDTDAAAVLEAIRKAALPGGLVVLSGSQPPGVAPDLAGRLARRLHSEVDGCRLLVDTSGAALRAAATGTDGVDILRMDGPEAETLAGRPLPERGDSVAFAAEIVARGAARAVVIARGADGSVLFDGTEAWHAAAADVPVRSKIGAGDSFVGAMVLALAAGATMPEALQQGAAAASATVMTDATELCDPQMVRDLVTDCALSRIALP